LSATAWGLPATAPPSDQGNKFPGQQLVRPGLAQHLTSPDTVPETMPDTVPGIVPHTAPGP
jgi:hypothetical protein